MIFYTGILEGNEAASINRPSAGVELEKMLQKNQEDSKADFTEKKEQN